MRQLLNNLWNDDAGALIAAEYLFVATILVIGTIVGLSGLREAVNIELTELGNALLALSQGYTINGTATSTGSASTDGSQAMDSPSTLGNIQSNPPAIPSVIDVPVY
jgi:Flp pilus assembly pilin Flp